MYAIIETGGKQLRVEEGSVIYVEKLDAEENSEVVFDKVVALAETKKSKYAIVKKWFMNHYKEAYAKEIEAQEIDKELQDIEAELAEMDDEMLEDIA